MSREVSASTPKTPKRNMLPWGIVLLLVIGVAFFIVWQSIQTPRGTGLLNALPKLLQELPKEQQRIGQIIYDNYVEYRANARNWSAVYFGCLFFSAACAALAGLVLKLEFLMTNDGFKKDLAALLAMMSALLITLSTAGGFHQRWWVNRLAAAKMEKLAYSFMTADLKVSLDDFSAQIQAISYERNEQIVSNDNERPKSKLQPSESK